MSTPVHCTQSTDYVTFHANRSGEVQIDSHGCGKVICINVKPEDLLAALKSEGILPEKSEAERKLEQVERLAQEWENIGAIGVNGLKRALELELPFVFPTGVGAVIEGRHINGGGTLRFVHTGKSWSFIGEGNDWTKKQIRSYIRELKVLSEGVDL